MDDVLIGFGTRGRLGREVESCNGFVSFLMWIGFYEINIIVTD